MTNGPVRSLTLTDTSGNKWVRIADAINTSGDSAFVSLWLCVNPVIASGVTFTATYSTGFAGAGFAVYAAAGISQAKTIPVFLPASTYLQNVNINADTHPLPPTAFDDEFQESILNASQWTLQNGASATLQQGSVIITNTGTGSDNWKFMTETLPANVPWFFAAKISSQVVWGSNPQFVTGIVLYDSVSTKLKTWGLANAGSLGPAIYFWTNPTTFSSNPYGIAIGSGTSNIPFSPQYYGIINTGTTLNYVVSMDGISWIDLFNEPNTNFMTPTSIGIGVNVKSSALFGAISCDWIRELD